MDSENKNKKINKEVKAIWDANAEWWDDKIGDGNKFQIHLIEPTTEKLLELTKEDIVLDIACGAGRFGRKIAPQVKKVVAFDFSAVFIERAKKRTGQDLKNIEYIVLDATKESDLLSLGINKFDWAVATMALMDISDITPLFKALRKILKPKGRFVFSMIHPCFHSAEIQKFCEDVFDNGRYIIKKGIKISKYRTPFTKMEEEIIGQPKPQYIFHRSLSDIFNIGFRNGFVIDRFEEPAFPFDFTDEEGLRWCEMPEIPPVLMVRMVLLEKDG